LRCVSAIMRHRRFTKPASVATRCPTQPHTIQRFFQARGRRREHNGASQKKSQSAPSTEMTTLAFEKCSFHSSKRPFSCAFLFRKRPKHTAALVGRAKELAAPHAKPLQDHSLKAKRKPSVLQAGVRQVYISAKRTGRPGD